MNLLIDPMLGEKGSLGKFPMTESELLNPLVELPFSHEELTNQLSHIDAVVVTHLHPDHWDGTAAELLDKNIPVICPQSISKQLSQQGFTNILTIEDQIKWKGIDVFLTKGLHGTGEIGDKMGTVNGFVFKNKDTGIYVVGDSIWCQEVIDEIDRYHPQHIIVAGGAATFAVGDPIIMTSEDIIRVCEYTPESKVWVTHLEALSHCKENRSFIQEKINKNGLEKRCFILKDGEEADLHDY